MEDKSSNLYQKMAKIMEIVGKIEKDGYNKFNKFSYQSIEAVNTAVRSAMNVHGVIMFSECVSAEVVEMQWNCQYEFTFVDITSGEARSCKWHQATPLANNKGVVDDKAMGKIHTYAQKYFLMRTFLVSTKGDIDLDASGDDEIGDPPIEQLATDETVVVVTKKEGKKTFMTIEGCTIWNREPFLELNYDKSVYDSLAETGVTTLPDPIKIVFYVNEKGYKEVLRIQRVSTKKVFTVKELD